MTSRETADSSTQGLDPGRFRTLFEQAMNECLQHLAQYEARKFGRVVYWAEGGQITSDHIEFPHYTPKNPDCTAELLELDSVKALLEYAWEQNAMRPRPKSKSSQRRKWESRVVFEFVHHPLCTALTESALALALDDREIPPWNLVDEQRTRVLDDAVALHHGNTMNFTAYCPLAYVKGTPGIKWDLGHGMTLCLLDGQETALYLSRFARHSPDDDPISGMWSEIATLQVDLSMDREESQRGNRPTSGRDLLQTRVLDLVDLAKWALSVGVGNPSPLIEGTIVFAPPHGGIGSLGGAFRRQFETSGTCYTPDDDAIEQASKLIDRATHYRDQSDDLHQGISHFGRSCLSREARDIALESVIGLERLLVSQNGEIAHRFALHGAALLASNSDEAEQLFRDLKAVYTARSNVVHKKNKKKSVEHGPAKTARTLLGKALVALLDKYEAGTLAPGCDAAKQLQEHVIRAAPIDL